MITISYNNILSTWMGRGAYLDVSVSLLSSTRWLTLSRPSCLCPLPLPLGCWHDGPDREDPPRGWLVIGWAPTLEGTQKHLRPVNFFKNMFCWYPSKNLHLDFLDEWLRIYTDIFCCYYYYHFDCYYHESKCSNIHFSRNLNRYLILNTAQARGFYSATSSYRQCKFLF